MGKKNCGNCESSVKITDKQKAYAQAVQAIKKKAILHVDKKKEIEALPDHEKFAYLVGLDLLTYNNLPVEIQGVDIYRVCQNVDQLKNAGIKENCNNIHKTYFTCNHYIDEMNNLKET